MGASDLSLQGLLRDLQLLTEQQERHLDTLDKRDDLIRALADRVLHLANVGEKNTEALLLTRQRITEIYEQREFIREGLSAVLAKLQSISKDLDDGQREVREATGAHQLMKAEERPSVAERLLDRFVRAPKAAQALLVLLVLGLALGGWLSRLADLLSSGH